MLGAHKAPVGSPLYLIHTIINIHIPIFFQAPPHLSGWHVIDHKVQNINNEILEEMIYLCVFKIYSYLDKKSFIIFFFSSNDDQ